MKIGITGGIGSGKSYVCKRLQRYGITVYDCDAAAKRLIRTSPRLQQQIVGLVGSLDKAAMSRFLLASKDNQQAMNNIIHPAVFSDFEASGMQWMESAILFEAGARRLVDKAVVVTAPEEVRIQRVMQRDGITREKAMQWISCQCPQDEVKALADYEIVNDGVTDIDEQIDRLLESISCNDETTKNKTTKQQNDK
jgi:dephospho-CoA kinase